MDAIILAAGEGRRMRPLTLTRPKALLPVAGKPLLEHVLAAAAQAGATRAHVIVHHGAAQIRSTIGAKGPHDIPITYQDQGEARGTGHALAVVDPQPQEPFLLLSADTIIPVKDLQALLRNDAAPSLVAAHRVEDARPYGALLTEGDRLVGIVEKSDAPPSDLVNTGVYRLDPAVFGPLVRLGPSPRGEIELTDAVNALAEDGQVHVHHLSAWTDVGRPWDLLEANRRIMEENRLDTDLWRQEGTIEPGVTIDGPVRVEAGAVVRTGTVIEGPAIIQQGARVGPLAYIRPHSVIGRSSHVGAHTEIKNSILFDEANSPHLNYVGDSILGARVNLGAGTVIANLRHDKAIIQAATGANEKTATGRRKFGAILGDDVKTGINVSLDCGTVVGPGALLAPGQAYWGHLEGDRVHYAAGKSGPRPRRARG